MRNNNFKLRRYFRFADKMNTEASRSVMGDFYIKEIDCFTSTDYENAFSHYCMPGTLKNDFRRLFDFVCLETEESKRYIEKALSANAGNVIEVQGEDRNQIEQMISRMLETAHRADMKMRHLPKAMADSTLRPYQADTKKRIIEEWKYEQRIMLQMPTGTGKTRLFVSLINDIHTTDPEARILIVTHRRELVEQVSGTLSAHYHLLHVILGKSDKGNDKHILIASIQKLSRMQELPPIDYIIIDEAHHSLATSYKSLMERCPSARVLGVTATPCRLKTTSFKETFHSLLLSHSIRWFINNGFLADYRLFTVSDNHAAIAKVNRLKKFGSNGDYRVEDLQEIINRDSEVKRLYQYYETYAYGKQGIVYAVSRDHAARIASEFNTHGIGAVSLDCDTPSSERARIISEFKSGKGVKVMVNVELFTEGFDCPDMDFVMLARPTRSLAMYLQQVGRALRPSSSRSKVTILDATGLYNRFGLPERPRDWQKLFIGIMPQSEKYTSRPLGTPGIEELMKEVTAIQAKGQTLHTSGQWSVCDFGGGRLGLCDEEGRRLYTQLYKKLSSYAEGWFVGERQSTGRDTVFDILVPRQRTMLTYTNFTPQGDGTYAVEVAGSLKLRFDAHLQLIPTTICELGGITLYRHGEDKDRCIYTLSLTLGTMELTGLTRYISGIIKLTDIKYEYVVFACHGEVFRLPKNNYYSMKYYFSDDKHLHVLTSDAVFRRISNHPILYQATNDRGITLCDKAFLPLCSGDSLETSPLGCTIYKGGKPMRTISFVDYLCGGR